MISHKQLLNDFSVKPLVSVITNPWLQWALKASKIVDERNGEHNLFLFG